LAATSSLITAQTTTDMSESIEWWLGQLSKLADLVKVLLSADRISLFLYDEGTEELCALVNRSCEIRLPSHLGIAGSVFTSGKPINVNNAYSDSRFLVEIDQQTGYKTRNILCMPIFHPQLKKVLGVIEVLNKCGGNDRESSFTTEDETTLNMVCHLSALVIQKTSPQYFSSPPSSMLSSSSSLPCLSTFASACPSSRMRNSIATMTTVTTNCGPTLSQRAIGTLHGGGLTSTSSCPDLTTLMTATPTPSKSVASTPPVSPQITRLKGPETRKRRRKNSIPIFHFRIPNL